jgi:hypothetical protein
MKIPSTDPQMSIPIRMKPTIYSKAPGADKHENHSSNAVNRSDLKFVNACRAHPPITEQHAEGQHSSPKSSQSGQVPVNKNKMRNAQPQCG